MPNQFSLLKTKRFLPLFIVQFLGAFNDNLLKTIVTVMIAYELWDAKGIDPAILVAAATGLFILPFILFSPIAGVMSDKFDKASMIKWIKLAEIIIAITAIAALFTGDLYFAFFVLFLLGAQSAFFAPCKLSILPDHLKRHELIGGNALVSTGTYLAILTGTIIGAIIAPLEWAKPIGSTVILFIAIIGYISALKIPSAPPKAPEIKISFNIFAKAISSIGFSLKQKQGVMISILGVAYFYFIAATFHAQFPNFTKQTLGADTIILTCFMIAFSLGIAIGGLLNNTALKAKAHGGLVPLACILMGIFGIDIYLAAKSYPSPTTEELQTFSTFISNIHGIRLLFDTFMQAVAAGLFVIPMRTIVQDRSDEKTRARVISSSNMMDALFILLSSIFASILFTHGTTIEGLYLTVSIITVFVGLFLFLVPSLRANHEQRSFLKRNDT